MSNTYFDDLLKQLSDTCGKHVGRAIEKDVSMTTVELRVATKDVVIYRTFEQEAKKLLNTAIVFPKYEIKLTNKDIPSINALAIKMVSGRRRRYR